MFKKASSPIRDVTLSQDRVVGLHRLSGSVSTDSLLARQRWAASQFDTPMDSSSFLVANLSVLLVEDSQLLADRLREAAQTVPGVDLAASVDSEAAAIRALETSRVDVVVVDLHLSGGTGFGVLRAMARAGDHHVVPIVLTNHDLGEYRRAAADLGVQYFLHKLRDFELLPQLLNRIAHDRARPASNRSAAI